MDTTDSAGGPDAQRLEAARQLGAEHGQARITPFGVPGHAYPGSGRDGDPSYPEYVYWDEGSARLLDALGETGDTTGENYPSRTALVNAYCDAYETARHSPGTPGIPPGT
jgi:hypothetical protein